MTAGGILEQLRRPEVRGYLYRVLSAAGGVAVGYGLITADELALWTGLVGILFALPAANTPVRPAGRHAAGEQLQELAVHRDAASGPPAPRGSKFQRRPGGRP